MALVSINNATENDIRRAREMMTRENAELETLTDEQVIEFALVFVRMMFFAPGDELTMAAMAGAAQIATGFETHDMLRSLLEAKTDSYLDSR